MKAASPAALHIRPCQPVCVVLDIVAQGSPRRAECRKLADGLAEVVTINGTEYKGLLPGTNRVGAFFLREESVRPLDGDRTEFQAVAILFWNAEAEECTFDRPGLYRIELARSVPLDVTVEAASGDEARVLQRIRSRGDRLGKFVFGMDAEHFPDAFELADQLVKDFPESSYAEHLSVIVGVNKFKAAQHRRVPGVNFQQNWDETAALRQYFEPFCSGELTSPYQAWAAYYLAQIEQEQFRGPPGAKNRGPIRSRDRAIELLSKVKDCRFAIDVDVKAAAELQKLTNNDK